MNKKCVEGRLKTMLKLYGGRMTDLQLIEFALLLGVYDDSCKDSKPSVG